MSVASFVPETHARDDSVDAWQTLSRVGWWRLAKDVLVRFKAADGVSHTRALAFTSVLGLFPGTIAVLGLATAFHLPDLRGIVEQTATGLAPGRSGEVLNEAFQGASPGAAVTAVLVGTLWMLVAGTFAMAQLERSANRLYGIQDDRPLVAKYRLAFFVYVSAGLLLMTGLVLLAAGGALGHALASAYGWSRGMTMTWSVSRWPVGIVIVAVAITIVFRRCPNRRQPRMSWLVTGTVVAVVLWVAFTAALAGYYGTNSTAQRIYGPLLGVLALLIWAYLSSFALHLGMAFAAQLEAVRAGVRKPEHRRLVTPPVGTGSERPGRRTG